MSDHVGGRAGGHASTSPAGRVGPAAHASGRLLVLEGPDGVGKTSQRDTLATWLRSMGCDVLCLQEPGSSAIAAEIRALVLRPALHIPPRVELLLFLAARADLWDSTVIPALGNGQTVLLDRASLSTCAYQGAGRGLPMPEVVQGCLTAQGHVVPDATLVLAASDATLDARRGARGHGSDRIEAEALLFTQRVRRFYREVAEVSGGIHADSLPSQALTGPIHAISAEGPFEEVAARVRDVAEFILHRAAIREQAEWRPARPLVAVPQGASA